MTKIILTLAVLASMNLMANPFNMMHQNSSEKVAFMSQKFEYAQRAAKQGNPIAQFDLGLMYAKGEGVAQNSRLAFNWLHKAARKGHIEAKFYMGINFAKGIGVREQPELARYWFKLAAKAGHPKAVAHLASIERSMRMAYPENARVALNK